jgi:inorganic pyrophosphatase
VAVWGGAVDLGDVPGHLIDRLKHYFLTYKLVPGEQHPVEIEEVYAYETAAQVVLAALDDYADVYGPHIRGD